MEHFVVTLGPPTWRQNVPQSALRGYLAERTECQMVGKHESGQCAEVMQTFGQLGDKVVQKCFVFRTHFVQNIFGIFFVAV